MMSTRIYLLGPFAWSSGESISEVTGSRKARALLARLAAEPGRRFSREELAELLWPGRFEKQGQQSLRQALTEIRKLLGDAADEVLQVGDGTLAILGDGVAVDTIAFNEAREARSNRKALDFYRGEFLAGFLPVSNEFDHWVTIQRSHFKAAAIPLCEDLIQQAEDEGDLQSAIGVALELTAIDPGHEEGHRRLMHLYWQVGQKSAALEQFEICKTALADLLDVEPEAATLALVDKIRNQDTDRKPTTGQTSAQPAAATLQAPPRRARGLKTALGVLVVAVAAVLAWLFAPDQSLESPHPAIASLSSCPVPATIAGPNTPVLLVMPIQNLADSEFTDLFVLSATDAILGVASSISGVTPLAGPTQSHPDAGLDRLELARKNKASHVFTATVRPDPGGLRFTMRLLEVGGGRQIWQDSLIVDDRPEDPARLQNELAIRAARGIQEHLSEGKQAIVYREYPPESLVIFEHNTKGFGYLAGIRPVLSDLARREFDAVLVSDPQNVSAHTGLGFYYISPILFRWPGTQSGPLERAQLIEKAERHARLSVGIDSAYAPAHNLLAIVNLLKGDHNRALITMEEGLRLSGGGADSTAFAGFVLSYTKDVGRARDLAARAMQLRPYSSPLWYKWSFARALRNNGETRGAITCLEEIDYNEQGIIAPALELIRSYVAVGDDAAAKPYVDLVMVRSQGQFSSRAYCEMPRHESKGFVEACLSDLAAVGFHD